MADTHVVVDGSNLATEGRTLPSLKQLDEAVRAFVDEYAPGTVTVVVDATFPNRIDPSERETFEEALIAGEVVTPPAGVIGRGDAFLLQIADRADALVLSNDSFQEFHGTYEWLFDKGRLVGGKPVPHVGWVFMERAPVRGPQSRRSVSDAKKAAKKAGAAAKKPAAKQPAATQPAATKVDGGGEAKGRRSRGGRRSKAAAAPVVAEASAEAAPEATRPAAEKAAARPAGDGGGGVEPYNDLLSFLDFVAAHPVGSTVSGQVERFSSHGAYVFVGDTRCYLPLKHMADPPPRSAREVLSMNEPYQFVVHGFDTPRRGVDLTIPGVVAIPAAEAAEVAPAGDPVPDQPTEEERVAPVKKAAARRGAKKAAARKAPVKRAAKRAPTKQRPAKKATARKTTARKTTARKAAVKKAGTATKKRAAAKKATKKRATKKAPAKRAAAKKATKKRATKKAPAKRAAAKKATRRTTRR